MMSDQPDKKRPCYDATLQQVASEHRAAPWLDFFKIFHADVTLNLHGHAHHATPYSATFALQKSLLRR
jgi:hypothetical protein